MPLTIVSRSDWGGIVPETIESMEVPVSYVVLRYKARLQQCTDPELCCQYLRNLQQYNLYIYMREDLDYNFYIGGDGRVYEGRGWTTLPIKDHDYHGKALDVCYMGMFGKDENPPEEMVQTMWELVKYGIENGFIKEDYKLIDRDIVHIY